MWLSANIHRYVNVGKDNYIISATEVTVMSCMTRIKILDVASGTKVKFLTISLVHKTVTLTTETGKTVANTKVYFSANELALTRDIINQETLDIINRKVPLLDLECDCILLTMKRHRMLDHGIYSLKSSYCTCGMATRQDVSSFFLASELGVENLYDAMLDGSSLYSLLAATTLFEVNNNTWKLCRSQTVHDKQSLLNMIKRHVFGISIKNQIIQYRGLERDLENLLDTGHILKIKDVHGTPRVFYVNNENFRFDEDIQLLWRIAT